MYHLGVQSYLHVLTEHSELLACTNEMFVVVNIH